MTKFKSILIAIILMATVLSFAGKIPQDTILAKFDGGTITLRNLNDRIEMIPAMYRSRYTSVEGKQQLLDMLCTEELFYLEAIKNNVENDTRFKNRIENQKKSIYAKVYKEDLIKQITLSSAEKKAYFNEHPEIFKKKSFEESEKTIERRLKSQKEKDLIENKKAELKNKYNIKILETNIELLDLENLKNNKANAEKTILQSSEDDLTMTIDDFIQLYEELPERNKAAMKSPKDITMYLNNLVELNIFYFETKDKDYSKNNEIKSNLEQIQRNLKLKTIYNQLVVDAIDLSDDKLQKYYQGHLKRFSSKAARKIQAFGFEDEKTANKMRKKVNKLIKKNNTEGLKDLISKSSIYKRQDGEIDNIYKNGIIPGIGKDKKYSDAVWNAETDPKKLSDVLKNSKGKFVFFRVLENNESKPIPFEDVKNRIKSTMQKDMSRTKFEEVKTELATSYNLQKYPKKLIVKLSIKEYFDKAEEAQKKKRFNDAIHYYDQIIKNYKNNTDDYKATFMKGFLYAEELNKKDLALSAFEKVLDYPEAELHESAEFMIKELKGEKDIIKNLDSQK